MLVRYVDSTSRAFDQTLLGWLLRELPTASYFAAATGYFYANILDWVEPQLDSLLRRGGKACLAIGSNQGQTSREDLERLFALLEPHLGAETALFVVHIPGGLFHPKTYFVSGPSHAAAFVGSANLTSASGTRNVEAAVTLEGGALEPPLDAISVALSSTSLAALANAFRVGSAADLATLEAMGAIGVPRPVTPTGTGGTVGASERARQRLGVFPAATRVLGVPAPTARRRGTRAAVAPPPGTLLPPVIAAGAIVAFVFSPNDLKQTGTREFSVPESVRTWAGGVLGGPVRAGQGDLLHVNVLARLASAPNTVVGTPGLVRIWSAGATGGTHQDVRMVVGSTVRTELEDLSVILYGTGLHGGDIGVLQLPVDPTAEPVRLTVYRPGDADFAALDGVCARMGRQQKRQSILGPTPAIARWPY